MDIEGRFDGLQGVLPIAVAPMNMRTREMHVRPLARRTVSTVGEDAEPFENPIDPAVGNNGVVVHGADGVDIQSIGHGTRLDDLRQRRCRAHRRWPGADDRRREGAECLDAAGSSHEELSAEGLA